MAELREADQRPFWSLAYPVIGKLSVLTLVLCLGGCFKSSTALIDQSNASYPFKTAELKTDDEPATQILKREGNVYHLIEDGEQRDAILLFYKIADTLYIVQDSPKNGEATYLFAKRDNDKIVVQTDCLNIDKGTLERLKIEHDENRKGVFFTCHVTDLKSLIELGQSPTLWSGETTTIQIISIE
ncbi:MAG TPA: hypothetical protein VKA94_09715 [Hyphomicrobiales bacterium]|nr:hypothetical protein [Hyphomicrobiales bacterium]